MSHAHHIAEFWSNIVSQAYYSNASDIHIEPRNQSTLIRFRVDGLLQSHIETQTNFHETLVAYIKIQSDLDIAEKRLPQDGSFRIYLESNRIDCRISSIPSIHGEKIVARLLPNAGHPLEISKLNLSDQQKSWIYKALNSSQGLILVTGPTGSGKTRTLFSFLNYLNDGTRNISSVEDPIEIQLDGITQIAINELSGMTFEVALRALLRQDPDIIMIGEIRDFTTASIAITAAQTGHLVLASLHTNSALDAIQRLLSLGCDRNLIASTLLLSSSQRLIRRSRQTNLNSISQGRIDVHEVIPFNMEMRHALAKSDELENLYSIAKSKNICFLNEMIQQFVEDGTLESQHANSYCNFFE